MRRFEYTYIFCPQPIQHPNLMGILKASGEDGWELCCFLGDIAFFKREIIEQLKGGAL